jgi:ABC-type antimicrobial peptide transport system ATPase subunit
MSEPLNTRPLEQFLQKVKAADTSKAREVKLDMQEARTLALTLGMVMARMEGELERLVIEAGKGKDEVINIEIGANKDSW